VFEYIRQLGRDSLFYGILDVASRFVNVFLVPLYTRVLSPADYGVIDLITTLMTVLYALFYLGLDSALIYYYNQSDEPLVRRRVTTNAVTTWLLAVSLGAFAIILWRKPISELAVPGITDAELLIWLSAVSLPLQAIVSAQALILRVQFAFRRFAFLTVSRILMNVVFSLYLILVLRMGIKGVLLAQIYSQLATGILGFYVMRREFDLSFNYRMAVDMVRYGAPLVLPNFTYWIIQYSERYALLRVTSLYDIGLFAIATRLSSLVTLVSNSIDIAWMPFALSIQKKADAPYVYARALTYYLLVSGLFGTSIALLAREALVVFTQPAYYAAHVLVGPLVASLMLRGAFNIIAIGAFVKKKTSLLGTLGVISALLNILFLTALVPVMGSIGAAFATLLTRVISILMLYLQTRSIYPVPYEWDRVMRMAGVFTIAVFWGVVISKSNFLASFLTKTILIYPSIVIALFLVGVIKRSEVHFVLIRLRRFLVAQHK